MAVTILMTMRFIRTALWVLLAVLFWSAAAPAGTLTAAATPVADVLVIHDSLPGHLPSGVVDGNNIIDLLGHFGLKGALMPVEQYKAGEINRYRFVFILGVDDRKVVLPPHLVTDIRSTAVPVFCLFKHIDELLNPQFSAQLGFRLSQPGILNGIETVSYRGKSLLKKEGFLFPVQVTDNSRVQVLATAQDKQGNSWPYIVRSGSFWYCADSPFSYTEEGDRYLAFCDLLHDFFRMPHQDERKALLRIEDVSVEDDADELRSLADYLFERHIPFQIALIPIFVDPSSNQEIYLSDRPQFVRAIQYMVSKGGLAVLHGVTHQYHGRSADDYEFWNENSDRPIQGDSRQLVEQKLRLALQECFKNGIYPVTWETPHYTASTVDYQTIARYFNTSYDRVPSTEAVESAHYFPYSTVDRFGRFIIPENLGYISIQKPDPDLLVANCERLQTVRDGVASLFFHPFMKQEYLVKVLDGIEALGYRFISIRDYDCRVQMDERLVQTFSDTTRLRLQGTYLHRFVMHADGRLSGESYSQKPMDGIVTDPGIVPLDSILVMEGVQEILPQKETPHPSIWNTFTTWVQKKFAVASPPSDLSPQPEVVVLWDENLTHGDWNNQESYINAFSSFGFRVTKRKWANFERESLDSGTVLVIPRAVAVRLSAGQQKWTEGFVRDGGRLVLDGPSALSEALGVRMEKHALKVRNLTEMLYGDQPMTWNPAVDVFRFTVRGQIFEYARDPQSEQSIAVLASYGKGRFIYLGARLDPITPLGYTRFPYLVHYVLSGFSLHLPLQRAQLELYFDPGLRQGKDIDRLALDWRRLGVRAIYAAAYHFWPSWSYNYEHLIDVCHKNGILVYAWFELPHVSKKFWDDHPEWRAKTATGADGEVGWRYHMDLDIPECRDAAFEFVEKLLRQYPWDGVNIAELNFDTINGPENPQAYLPMGAATRAAFKTIGGFDPIQLFSPDSRFYWKNNAAALKRFEQYRSQTVLAWHRALLDRITPLAQERDMEVVVTMLDSIHSPTLTRDSGVDSTMILPLMDQYPFTLQVEDPAHFWADSPDRYRKFTETYRNLVRDPKRLMFDINIVRRAIEHSHSATPLAVGVELAQSLIFASAASGRAGIYSEATVPFQDLQTLSRVLAYDSRLEKHWNSWETDSRRSVLLNTPGKWENFRVDGSLWPGWGENEVFIPAGNHMISAAPKRFRLLDTSILDFRLLRFTGNLDTLKPTNRGLGFSYDSGLRTMALFNRQPFEIYVDGQLYQEPPVSYYAHWSVRLPRGRHTIEVIADSTANIILDRTSLYSSTMIVIFGTVACALMLFLYMAILVRRAVARAVNGKAAS